MSPISFTFSLALLTFSLLKMFKYYIINKPFNMLSQFTREGDNKSLADLDFEFDKDVYPIGRLDSDSEGLLILTNDKRINAKLLSPENEKNKVYFVQVEGIATPEAIDKLKKGVEISINGTRHMVKASAVELQKEDPKFWERNPPIRVRKSVPDCWLKITIHEGKNRQIRRMTAAVGFPTLRIIRTSIQKIKLANLLPGDILEINSADFYSQI